MSRQTWTPPVALCAPIPAADCYPGATVRPDWTLPTRDGYHLVAIDTGEWLVCWCEDGKSAADTLDEDMAIGDEFWPFVEDVARSSDWRAVGIETY